MQDLFGGLICTIFLLYLIVDLTIAFFVISDMMANLELLKGWPIVAFHGAVEWALDYILTTEVVWMPTEEQLRQELEEILLGEPEVVLQLSWQPQGYNCDARFRGELLSFAAETASDAYGLALLHILQHY